MDGTEQPVEAIRDEPRQLPSGSEPTPTWTAPASEPVSTAVDVAPESSTAIASPVPGQIAAASADAPEMLPTVGFTCTAAGAGWTASAAGAAFAQDPLGYHLWYQADNAPWRYWGHFMSGLASPDPLSGLLPGTELDVRIDRELHEGGAGAPTMLMFTAPDHDC
jgi:hypothetical protein